MNTSSTQPALTPSELRERLRREAPTVAYRRDLESLFDTFDRREQLFDLGFARIRSLPERLRSLDLQMALVEVIALHGLLTYHGQGEGDWRGGLEEAKRLQRTLEWFDALRAKQLTDHAEEERTEVPSPPMATATTGNRLLDAVDKLFRWWVAR